MGLPSSWDRGLLEFQLVIILADELTHSELQCWGSSSKSTRDTQGRTELSSFRVRTEGAALSWTKVPVGVIIHLLSPHPTQPIVTGRHQIWVSIKFTPPWWFPENQHHPTGPEGRPLSPAVTHQWLTSARAVYFTLISEKSTNLQQAVDGPVPLAKLPPAWH